jgi:hypothetical protein
MIGVNVSMTINGIIVKITSGNICKKGISMHAVMVNKTTAIKPSSFISPPPYFTTIIYSLRGRVNLLLFILS